MSENHGRGDVERMYRRVDEIASRVQKPDRDDEARMLLGEMRSLLEQIQIERELVMSEARALFAERQMLQQIFDLAPDAYLVTDADGAIREANRAASQLLGEGVDAIRGRAIRDFVAETQRPLLASRVAGAHRSGGAMEWEMTLEAREGQPRTVVAVTVAGAADGDRLAGLRWLLRDISHQKRAQFASRKLLEEQAARAHAEAGQRRDAFLAEASQILAGSLDYEVTLASIARLAVPHIADSCIAYVVEEDGSVRRPGVAHVDPARENALRALLERHPFDPHSLTRPVARVLRTGEVELLPELPLAEADPLPEDVDDLELAADIIPRSLMVVPLRLRDRILGALSFGWAEYGKYTPDHLWLARKLADRAALAIENARLHGEARQASQAKSDFVAAMSHEFRTPLTAILAFADMLAAGIPEPVPAVAQRHAERIVVAAKHLGVLIDQVLALSRIEAGRERVHAERVDLAALVHGTVSLVEPLARQKELPLRVEVPDAEVLVETDPNLVRQVLFNLLGNAVKFTERGEIRVLLRASEGGVLLEVHDTGEGIAPEDLERIWEPFWRGSAAGGGRSPGTGLGLGIVKRLVRMLGGEVRARSEPGHGSVFVVELAARPDR